MAEGLHVSRRVSLGGISMVVSGLTLAAAFLSAAQAAPAPVDLGVRAGAYGPPSDYIIRSLIAYDPEGDALRAELEAEQAALDAEIQKRASGIAALPRSNAWEPTVKVSGAPERTIIGEWDEDNMADGTILAGWITSSGGIGCGFKTSHDGGKTWDPVHYADGGSSGGDPVIIPDPANAGTVYQSCIVQQSGTRDVFSKSTDYGKTWGAWNGPSWNPVTLDFHMVVARNKVLVMAFNQGQADTNSIKSTDDGATWSPKVDIAAGWPNCIEEDKDGNLYIFSGNGGQSLTFEKSTDYGGSWSSAKSTGVSGGSRASCVTDKISGNIYAVTESSTAVTVVKTTDGGNTFTNSKVHTGSGLGDMGSAAYASMAVDDSGALHVGFLSNENNQRHAYYSKSTDQGATWSQVEKISDHTGSGQGGQIAHYGHGMAIVPGSTRVCFGYTIVQTSGMEYRHTCSGAGGGGGGGGLARIDVAPNPGTVAAGATLQFTATGYNSNGTPVPITPTWTGTGGTVSSTGLYTPNGPVGAYSVEAAVGNIKGTAVVNVVAGAVASITVTPAAQTITADDTQQYTAAGKDSAGNPVTVAPVWSTTGGAVDASGLYTPDKIGTFEVAATDKGVKGTASVTVIAGKAVALKVDPPTATVRADSTQQFKALATDAKGNEASVTASWKVDGVGAGSIGANGLYTPSKVGSYTVTATAGSLAATAQVEVVPGKLYKIAISPKSASMNVGEEKQFEANASDSKGNAITGLAFTWTVTGGIGEITDGTFKGTKAGSGKVTVKATEGTIQKEDSATVSVKENPLAAVGFSNIMDLLMLIIGLVIVLIVVGVIVSLVRKRGRKQHLETWMQGYEGQPYPEQQQLQQWMQNYEGQPPEQGGPPRY
jgi:hypothetical protein